MEYGIKKKVDLSYEEAVKKTIDELKKESFGVLTQIDVKETLKKKIDVDFDKYIILGACNPNFAYKALLTEQDLGLLLPCNVIIYEKENSVYVSSIDPAVAMGFIGNSSLEEIAKDVRERLKKVIENI